MPVMPFQGHALVVKAGGADGVKDSAINTGFVKTLTGLVPYDSTHFGFPPLIVQVENIVVQVVRCKMAVMGAHGQHGEAVREVAVRVLVE